jgi:hypothetical protein
MWSPDWSTNTEVARKCRRGGSSNPISCAKVAIFCWHVLPSMLILYTHSA